MWRSLWRNLRYGHSSRCCFCHDPHQIQVELLLERTALRDDKYQAGNSFLDQLSEIVNNGENSDKEVTEPDSLNNILLDSFLDFGGETEETRSAFVGGSIFDRADKKTVPSARFDSDRILFGLERRGLYYFQKLSFL